MSEEVKRYGIKITALGASRIAGCILGGTKLKIAQTAAGDSDGGYYVPTVGQTELVGKLWRGPIVSAVQNPSVPNMLDVKIVIDDSVGNFVCREMGLFSEDGALIAVCNTPDTEKVAISTGVDGRHGRAPDRPGAEIRHQYYRQLFYGDFRLPCRAGGDRRVAPDLSAYRVLTEKMMEKEDFSWQQPPMAQKQWEVLLSSRKTACWQIFMLPARIMKVG